MSTHSRDHSFSSTDSTQPDQSSLNRSGDIDAPLPASVETASTQQNAQAIHNLTSDVADLHDQAQSSKRLKKRVSWLTGLLAASLVILGGGLIATTLNLRQKQADLQVTQEDLAQQIESASDAQSDLLAGAEQLSQLQQQLQALNQQAQALTTQARDLTENLTEGLPNISSQQWSDLQERLQSLEQNIQDGIAGDTAVEKASEQLNKIQEMLQGFQEMLGSPSPSEESPELSTTESQSEN